jgi:hypothetical protein
MVVRLSQIRSGEIAPDKYIGASAATIVENRKKSVESAMVSKEASVYNEYNEFF